MTEDNFLKKKKEESFGPLVLITGEEDFLIADWLKRIKDQIIDPGTSDFNFNLYDGSSANVEEILTAAQTFPFLSEKRLIILKEADLIPPREMEKLVPYLNTPVPSTCLVIVAPKADMRKTFFIRFKEKGRVISCQRLYENQIGSWVRNFLRGSSIEIDENAVMFLKTEIGTDLSRLAVEIEKLKSFIGERKKITFDDCVALTKGQRSGSVFDLVNAVGSKNRSRALYFLSGLLQEGQQPLVLLAMLLRHFRNLLKLSEFKKSGFSRMEVSKGLGIPEKYLSDIYQHSTLYSRSEIEKAFFLCLEADLQLKSSVRPPERVMESLILDLCEGKRLYGSATLLENKR